MSFHIKENQQKINKDQLQSNLNGKDQYFHYEEERELIQIQNSPEKLIGTGYQPVLEKIKCSDNTQVSDGLKTTVPSYRVSVTGTILLIMTLFSTAAILPLQVSLPLDITLLKLSWRNSNVVPFLLLLSIYDLFTKRGVFLVIFRTVSKKPVHKFELIGLFLAIFGCFISVLDKDVQKVDQSSLNIVVGDISGILCSLASAFYYQFNAQLVSKIPSSVAVCSTLMFSEIMIIIYGLLFGQFTFDRDKMTGVWGFMNAEYILYTLFIMGLFCGTISIYTAALVLKYYPPIVLMIVSLIEPIICQVLSCLMNIDRAPGYFTYVGGIITLFGIFGVSYGGQILEKNTKKQEKQSKQ
ncbi:UNKNOWN [Stylonychia lemnae]|uniref:Drug metabolite transporter superfamily n=1 Tax=Stylonychia lemnae TaxID=5949 RepID=A0A078B7L6_STYLE|nr:UNKNOWN [Stylonychia lemnae]|eukprot:CDW90216.1 UNKNOWN [Stylonychia lemnae]